MMNAVTYILNNNATVGTLVGANTAASKKKVYPVIVPSSEVEPYISVRILSRERVAKDCADYRYTVAVSSFTLNYDTTEALNTAVINALEGQASGTVNGEAFGHLRFISDSDEYAVDRIAITHEHPVYLKTAIFVGMGQ